MIAKRALNDSKDCNVKVAEWFSSPTDRQKPLTLLELAKPKLSAMCRLKRMEAWLSSQ